MCVATLFEFRGLSTSVQNGEITDYKRYFYGIVG